jgi:predicted ATPase
VKVFMAYAYSNTDNKNLDWFLKDNTRATLFEVRILYGAIRGLSNVAIPFLYPITAIAGKNGSGKSTILAFCACAFHNVDSGHKLTTRNKAYYTYSDFFVQTEDDKVSYYTQMAYKIFYNKWRKTANLPTGEGIGNQSHKKKVGGRWSDYSKRVIRTVVYLGIERIVPHSEKGTVRLNAYQFITVKTGWEDEIRELVGRILGNDYSYLKRKQYSKHHISVVGVADTTYSSLNMGAGESGLLELFSVIRECPDGSLILVDELELGLHEEAQARLILELKEICLKRKIQIICTTHSSKIMEVLPPEGRLFIERYGKKVDIIPGISPQYAAGKLAGRPSKELDIICEDGIAEAIVSACLPAHLKYRVSIFPVGSSSAVATHAAVRFRQEKSTNLICIFDGDKLSSKAELLKKFFGVLESFQNKEEKSKAREWFESRCSFLPGDEWPEAWVVNQRGNPIYERLQREFELSSEKVNELLTSGKLAGKHNEFFEISRQLNIDRILVMHNLVLGALEQNLDEKTRIKDFILTPRFLA